jgi:hypothetical protein
MLAAASEQSWRLNAKVPNLLIVSIYGGNAVLFLKCHEKLTHIFSSYYTS